MAIKLGMFQMPATLPGRPLGEVIDWTLENIRRAEEYGFQEFWVGEHMTSRWEPIAAPQLVIARALGETSRIHLGTGVEVLYQSHPVRLAVELAQLDHMARGRLLFGFGGGGTPTDFQLYGVDVQANQHQDMAQEALQIILDCWKPGGPDEYHGRYWSVFKPTYNERYSWHIVPYAPPETRIAFAGFMPKSGSMLTAGERGYIPISFNVAPEHIAVHWKSVEEGAARSGRNPNRAAWRQIREIYVAETEAEARRAVLDGFAGKFWNEYFGLIAKRINIAHLFRRERGPMDAAVDANYLVDHGTWFVGTPDKVAAQILEQYDMTGGFGVLLQIGFDYSDPGAREGWFRSMALLANEVMPRVNAQLAARGNGKIPEPIVRVRR